MQASVADHSTSGRVFQPGFRKALWLLHQAQSYADELDRRPWDFAVEIAALREAGLTSSDLRWLICCDYVEHRREITQMESREREFADSGPLVLDDKTCFVLSPAGTALARDLPPEAVQPTFAQGNCSFSPPPSSGETIFEEGPRVNSGRTTDSSNGPGNGEKPQWDGQRHEFRFGPERIKVFKLPSPNQEAILTAFEEESWPPRIDDPLPPRSGVNPKRRLRETIKSLNRNQKAQLVRFLGDGTGEGVRWELL